MSETKPHPLPILERLRSRSSDESNVITAIIMNQAADRIEELERDLSMLRESLLLDVDLMFTEAGDVLVSTQIPAWPGHRIGVGRIALRVQPETAAQVVERMTTDRSPSE